MATCRCTGSLNNPHLVSGEIGEQKKRRENKPQGPNLSNPSPSPHPPAMVTRSQGRYLAYLSGSWRRGPRRMSGSNCVTMNAGFSDRSSLCFNLELRCCGAVMAQVTVQLSRDDPTCRNRRQAFISLLSRLRRLSLEPSTLIRDGIFPAAVTGQTILYSSTPYLRVFVIQQKVRSARS
ncbi:uncharacterized protein BJX67DRAFT_189971 [Aspergillus lucknowensis]|uniref:Uncharacterized protein n=1 Tax=Aspergillus lucknowensis TaxID=176173 RepID=A0ABR4LKW2_9EURO